jgi:hypothetical protein
VLKPQATDEQGSIVLSLMIIVVSVIALTALSNSLLASLNQARNEQSRSSALQLANAGLDLAVYRIDSGEMTADFTDTYTESTGTATIEGTVTGDGTWQVRSVGHDAAGKERQVVATVSTPKLFPDALFLHGDFALSGNQDLYFYDSSVGNVATLATPSSPMPASIGTNGTLDGSAISQFSSLWAGFNMYGRATQAEADAACVGCGGAPKVVAVTDKLNRTPPSAPASALPCPSGGLVNGGSIPPGDYVCSSLDLRGTVAVGGRVRVWVNGPLSSSGAVVNQYGRPQNFQLFQPTQEDGSPYPSSSSLKDKSEIWGLLFTPGLVIDETGNNLPEVHGAMIVDSYAGTGNQMDFYYDVQTSTVRRDGTFAVTNWRECPVGPTAC